MITLGLAGFNAATQRGFANRRGAYHNHSFHSALQSGYDCFSTMHISELKGGRGKKKDLEEGVFRTFLASEKRIYNH